MLCSTALQKNAIIPGWEKARTTWKIVFHCSVLRITIPEMMLINDGLTILSIYVARRICFWSRHIKKVSFIPSGWKIFFRKNSVHTRITFQTPKRALLNRCHFSPVENRGCLASTSLSSRVHQKSRPEGILLWHKCIHIISTYIGIVNTDLE